ncbi:MAG: hypothetical protein BroJett015_31770 [Chloroflexota bacterium]|nr:hypothetical protein [Ardenticatenaceae bacterium]GIK57514.1 MAG: hypothetical protein BroJett015_31770 [Chloroflexota bacterium]
MINSYLCRLYDTVISRGYIEVEQLVIDSRSTQRGAIRGRAKFYDGSILEFGEVIILRNRQVVKLRYAYHYQNASGELVFRYDNAPHYPHIPTHPHHKHVGSEVKPAQAPDLSEVLHEIEQMIFESS